MLLWKKKKLSIRNKVNYINKTNKYFEVRPDLAKHDPQEVSTFQFIKTILDSKRVRLTSEEYIISKLCEVKLSDNS